MTSLRGEVDDVEIEADGQGATVLVELGGAIVLARIDPETSKDDLGEALLETKEQLDLATYYRSSPAGSLEEARKLRADGGRA